MRRVMKKPESIQNLLHDALTALKKELSALQDAHEDATCPHCTGLLGKLTPKAAHDASQRLSRAIQALSSLSKEAREHRRVQQADAQVMDETALIDAIASDPHMVAAILERVPPGGSYDALRQEQGKANVHPQQSQKNPEQLVYDIPLHGQHHPSENRMTPLTESLKSKFPKGPRPAQIKKAKEGKRQDDG